MNKKLTKFWGVMLTLIILVGLLVPMASAPTKVAAGDLQWTEVPTPNHTNEFLRPGSDVDHFVVAPDGKTMFAYTNRVSTVLTANVPAAGVTLNVVSTEGFRVGDTVIIGSAATPDAAVPVAPNLLPANHQAAAVGLTVAAVTSATVLTLAAAPATVAHNAGETVISVTSFGRLLKSTDGGYSWSGVNIGIASTTTAGSGLNGVDQITSLAVSADYANDQTVVAGMLTPVGGFAQIRRSVDGGGTWSVGISIPFTVATSVIRSVAVGPWYKGGQAILVGWANAAAGTGGAAVYKTVDLGWENLTAVAGWAPGVTGGDVLAVAFSPYHKTDSAIVIVTSVATDTFVRVRLAANAWDADVDPCELRSDAGGLLPAHADLRAYITFPNDFEWSSNNRILVAIGDATPTVVAGVFEAATDVYRAQMALAGGTSRAYDLNANGTGVATKCAGIAFKGNLADGKCMVAQNNSRDVLTSTNVSASIVTWVISTKGPGPVYGGLAAPGTPITATAVVASPTGESFYVATTGDMSALFESTDGGVSFDAIALLDITSLAAVRFGSFAAMDENNFRIVLHDNNDFTAAAPFNTQNDRYYVLRSANAGNTWKAVLMTRQVAGARDYIKSVTTSGTVTDLTMYAYQTDTRFWKSSNGGATWVGYTAQDNIITMYLVDKDTYFTGHINKVYKAGRFTEATLDGETADGISRIDANTLAVTTSTGDILTSTDDGVTFSRLGPSDSFGAGATTTRLSVDPKFATNKIVYGTSNTAATGGIYRWVMGQSTIWEKIDVGIVAAFDIRPGPGFGVASDGTMYAPSSVVGIGVVRQVNPSKPLGDLAADANNGFERMMNAQVLGYTATMTAGSLARRTAAGVNYLYAGITNNTGAGTAPTGVGTAYGSYIYQGRILVLADSITSGPAVVNPKAGTSITGTNYNLQWTAFKSPVQITYGVQVATDSGFQGTIVGGLVGAPTTAVSMYTPAALVPGQAYWWRVRVMPASPLASRWADGIAFTAKLGVAQFAVVMITPAPQEANKQPIRPTFSWLRVEGAESYEFELADNPFFGNPQSKKPLTNTVWTWDKDLEYETTYYYRVRAVSGKNFSEWVSGVITTLPKAAPAITIPPQPTPTIIMPTTAPVKKYFDPQSGLYFESDAELKQYQQAHPAGSGAPTTPAYIWAIIIIGAVLVIAVIVLIVRTRRIT